MVSTSPVIAAKYLANSAPRSTTADLPLLRFYEDNWKARRWEEVVVRGVLSRLAESAKGMLSLLVWWGDFLIR
jgi:hypothetical protein